MTSNRVEALEDADRELKRVGAEIISRTNKTIQMNDSGVSKLGFEQRACA